MEERGWGNARQHAHTDTHSSRLLFCEGYPIHLRQEGHISIKNQFNLFHTLDPLPAMTSLDGEGGGKVTVVRQNPSNFKLRRSYA